MTLVKSTVTALLIVGAAAGSALACPYGQTASAEQTRAPITLASADQAAPAAPAVSQ